MRILSSDTFEGLCDYSFGDQAGAYMDIWLAGMRPANATNTEFFEKCEKKKHLTLFIDNVRLYRRPIIAGTPQDQERIDFLVEKNDLLELCAQMSNTFTIFTGHEDVPIDSHITIPDNVHSIHAVNALHFGGKIHPLPYGLQRKMVRSDKREEIMGKYLSRDAGQTPPTKLLYMNCAIGRNPERQGLKELFDGFATMRIEKNNQYFTWEEYDKYLNEILEHKFIICPPGHGADCHRNWETLYMRRVPIMKDTPYYRELTKGLPALFVKDYKEVTKGFLEEHEYLFQEAQELDLSLLDAEKMFHERASL